MTLVCEPEMGRPAVVLTRVVLDHGELAPRDVDEVRALLQRAIANLPKRMEALTICRMPGKG